jgi:L-ascorbate metabolism protein UlaG (beta-lactamase superfamily)
MPIATCHGMRARDILHESPDRPAPLLAWLGQAGVLVRCRAGLLAIDPYLSDSLAAKYRGARFPHIRMMPPPVAPEELTELNAVLCTHSHTDHMDPGTLGPLARANPGCRFVVPSSSRRIAEERGVPPERLITADAGETGTLAGGVRWHALASAHEELKTDEAGRQMFLGYVIEVEGLRIYHSGDCVPYPGLAAALGRHQIDVAILPVNGRDIQRSAAGIPGNFTFAEAVDLCHHAGIEAMLACHFGMFDFNTVSEAWLDQQIAGLAGPPQCVRPDITAAYELHASGDAAAGAFRSRQPRGTTT